MVQTDPPQQALDEEALQGLHGGLLLGQDTVRTIRRTLLMTLVIALLQALYNGYLYGLHLRHIGAATVIALLLSAYVLLGRSQLRLALRILVSGLTITILALCWVVAGVRTPALFFLSGICTFAALQVSLQAARLVFAGVVVNTVALVAAEQLGFAVSREPSPTIGVGLMLTFSTLGALVTASAAYRSFRRQFVRVLDLSNEQALQMQELRRSEERFSALFKANPMPSSTNDQDGRIIDVNNAWEHLFGLAASAVVGKTAPELGLSAMGPERAAVAHVLASAGRVEGMPLTLINAHAEPTAFLIYIAPVEFGGARRYVTTLLDQTDRIAAETAQRRAQEELEQLVDLRTAELQQTVQDLTNAKSELVRAEKLASLGAMVAGISHELNTPIGVTVTAASTFQAQAKDVRGLVASGQFRRTDLEDFLQMVDESTALILRSSHRAADLIASFKQVAVDRSSQRKREFELRELIDDIVTSLKPSFAHKKVSIPIDVAGPIVCNSWPGAVGQVLTNLVQNACVHAFDGRDQGTITISAHVDGDFVELRVQDDGSGMSEDNLKHAFDPFFTTRLGKGGSGLGLSVSYNIAHSVLAGSLSATSQLGHGSCMTLRFLKDVPDLAPDSENPMADH